MKCDQCNSEWNANNSINSKICPFCGSILFEFIECFQSISEAIKYLINECSEEILNKKTNLIALMSVCLNGFEKEIDSINILYDSGIAKKLIECKELNEDEIERVRKRSIYQLRVERGINEIWARYAVDSFLVGIGVNIPYLQESTVVELMRSAERGDAQAQYDLAIGYKNGKIIKKSSELSRKWMLSSALQGHSDAQYEMSIILRNAEQYDDAKEMLLKSAEKSNIKALCALAYYHMNGLYEFEKNINKAISYYLEAAENESVIAIRELGIIYAKLNDDKKSIEYFRRAKDLGDSEAAMHWAWNCIKYEKDALRNSEYKMILEDAAKKGSVDSYFKLGYLYEGNYFITPNYPTAIYMYKKAAENGHKEAARRLGEIYLNGLLNVDKDIEESRYWYFNAAYYGDIKSRNLISYKNRKSPFTKDITITYDDETEEVFEVVGTAELGSDMYIAVKSYDGSVFDFVRYVEFENGNYQLYSVEDKKWDELNNKYIKGYFE